jgi:ribosome-binding factor A
MALPVAATLVRLFLIFSCVLPFGRKAVEKRGAKYHRGRLGEALREEIETLVEGELSDPRIGLVRVTAVHLAEDGRSAQVMVDVDGDDAEAERSMQGLDAAKAFIRHELADRLRLRRAPELLFRLDRSEREKARVEELLGRLKKKIKAKDSGTASRGEKA